ncbi:MAG: tetratricopeptide repeat protein [bacterium]
MKKILFVFLIMLLIMPSGVRANINIEDTEVIYYNEWEIDKVTPIARQLLEKDKLAPEEEWFLGLFYFYQGEYNNALKHMTNAREKVPDSTEWNSFASFVKKTADIARGFSRYESEHFILRLDKKDDILVEYALSVLEKGYKEIGNDLDFYPEAKILVEIYPTSEGFNVASSLSKRDMEVSGAIGICKFNRLMIVSPRCMAFGYRWMDSLVHEYTHFVVNIKSNGKCPLWLHEGIAKFEEQRWRGKYGNEYLTPVHRSLLREAIDKDALISFERMSPSLVKLQSQKEVTLAFAEASSAVGSLVKSSGEAVLANMLDAFREGGNYHKIIEDVTDKPYARFEKDWINFIEDMNPERNSALIMDSFKLRDDTKDYDMQEYVDETLRTHVRLGDAFKKRGKFLPALSEYRKALVKQTHSPAILNRMGKVHIELGNLDKAQEYFKKAIATSPNYVSSYTNLAELYFNEKNMSKALEYYEESNQINPFNPIIHKNMGLIYNAKDKEKAKREWKITEKLSPQDFEVKSWLMHMGE